MEEEEEEAEDEVRVLETRTLLDTHELERQAADMMRWKKLRLMNERLGIGRNGRTLVLLLLPGGLNT